MHEHLTHFERAFVEALHDIARAIRHHADTHATPAVGLAVTAAIGRKQMAIKPVSPLSLSDVERVQLSLAPKLANGTDDPGPFAWVSDNPAVASIVGVAADGSPDLANTQPTTATVWVLTPADAGSANIVATSASPNVDGNSIALTITEGRSGSVNLSAGTPVSDL
jgi:hypothetical protein